MTTGLHHRGGALGIGSAGVRPPASGSRTLIDRLGDLAGSDDHPVASRPPPAELAARPFFHRTVAVLRAVRDRRRCPATFPPETDAPVPTRLPDAPQGATEPDKCHAMATTHQASPWLTPTASHAQGAMAQLNHEELTAFHAQTLRTPRREYGGGARTLFKLLDIVYGKPRTLSKFKVLELVARVPYQAWEQVAYVAITHNANRPQVARRIFDRVTQSRNQEDNEQWHLLMLEELIARQHVSESRIKFSLLPQVLAFVYYQLCCLLYTISPAWSYRLNADFEDHAEHEYALLVTEHPDWEQLPFDSAFSDDYAQLDSIADLFRQICFDERVHKEESLAAIHHGPTRRKRGHDAAESDMVHT